MTVQYSKTCTLCPTKIHHLSKLCHSCYKAYNQYMNEAWFKILEEMQKKQDTIDRKEYYLSEHDNNQEKNKQSDIHYKKRVGQPSTPWLLEQKVLDIFDESVESGKKLSLRAIAKKLNNQVKYLTVRRILLDYRKQHFSK